MSLPSYRQIDGLMEMVQKGCVTEEQWLQIAENRRRNLQKTLDGWSLPSLTDVRCLKVEGFQHSFRENQLGIEVSGLPRGLDLQGIFGFNYESHQTFTKYVYPGPPRDGTLVIWGLTKKAKWIIARVTFKGSLGYKDRGREDATQVDIAEVTLPELCKEAHVTAREVCDTIEEAVREKHRSVVKQANFLGGLLTSFLLEREISDRLNP